MREALRRALAVRQPAAGLVVHSDQGSPYAATRFKDLLARHEALPSMDQRGNCDENAHAKCFWRRLQTKLLDGGSFSSRADALPEISHYVAHYNAERPHSALGYPAPDHSESQRQTTSRLCPA